ncbi:X-Pro dipeptidyl-peptidase C-terminal non-catalytic domain-containing protein [Sphingobium sp. AP50]|uniref:CocE/NonD family hydrolase C-terminal non-catalytic domain-containing protein n=1 Tax=Sphingobium sp. AP50 TaxID=1884369 RepID=UPI0008D52283|nr:X-Pro dipeptidyl-peptidase C-terminal non-catalytic domain-containing protein [Sphingobium sp. AP50]
MGDRDLITRAVRTHRVDVAPFALIEDHEDAIIPGTGNCLTPARLERDRKIHPAQMRGRAQRDPAASGTDSDWVVKLIDVYPNDVPETADQGGKPSMAGYELPIGIEIFRGRYREDFARPVAIKPGKVECYSWALPNVNHVFLPGHRIMVQVQSSLFPLYDRNPQSFVDNIMFTKLGDYKKATQSIWHGGAAVQFGDAADRSLTSIRSRPQHKIRQE